MTDGKGQVTATDYDTVSNMLSITGSTGNKTNYFIPVGDVALQI